MFPGVMSSHSYTKPSRTGYSKPVKTEKTGASPEYMAQVLGIKRVRSTTPVSLPVEGSTKKRKTRDNASNSGIEKKPKSPPKKKGDSAEEKRLKRFRLKAPLSYLERLGRVKTQRMFLIDRNRTTSADGMHEEEVFDIAGTTGNVYQVTITKLPTCSCPDSVKG